MLRASLSAFLAFVLFFIIHLLDFHLLIPFDRTHHLLGTAGLGMMCFFVLIYVLPNETWFQTKLHLQDKHMQRFIYPSLGVLFYGFLFLGYLEFYFTAERSITFRMLMIIDQQPNHSITADGLYSKYDVPNIINKRFGDLVYGGYLSQKEGIYQLTNKGKTACAIYRFTIDYLHLDHGEKKQTAYAANSA